MVRERLEAMALKRREVILYHYCLEVVGQEGLKPSQSILENDCWITGSIRDKNRCMMESLEILNSYIHT